jgi:hypothetical protein
MWAANPIPLQRQALRDTYGTLETQREAKDEAIQYANQGAKCLRLRNLAEREGFESA